VKAFPAVQRIRAGPVHRDGDEVRRDQEVELTEFDNPMSRGIIAIGVDDGDELIAARLTSGKDYIFLGSHDGQAIRFNRSQVRPWAGRRAACAAWIWRRATSSSARR
jgi:DNA gyrase/topoisomerase IV subunit A